MEAAAVTSTADAVKEDCEEAPLLFVSVVGAGDEEDWKVAVALSPTVPGAADNEDINVAVAPSMEDCKVVVAPPPTVRGAADDEEIKAAAAVVVALSPAVLGVSGKEEVVVVPEVADQSDSIAVAVPLAMLPETPGDEVGTGSPSLDDMSAPLTFSSAPKRHSLPQIFQAISQPKESKRPRLYNEAYKSEEGLLTDTYLECESTCDNDDGDEEEDEEDDDDEEEDTLDMDGNRSGLEGCLKIKGSIIEACLKPCNKIGSGGYGTVFKACIYGMDVAVKILHDTSAIGSENAKHLREFDTEVNILSQIRHPNLVRLIGSCKKKRALIYEYLSNGTLEEHIQIHKMSFTWKDRVQVAVGICEALVFLHSRADPVVHGDLKSTNILLDSSYNVKVGDFGISRILKLTSASGTNDEPKGTGCYMDPQFFRTSQLTAHSDTYAFGIILLRLVTGRSAKDLKRFLQARISAIEFESDEEEIKTILKQKKVIDAALEKDMSGDELLNALVLLWLGLECSEDNSRERPSLADQVFPKLKQLNEKAM